jgi:hypothetical protein
MEEKLKRYVDRKFRLYPKTREITEFREELYSMMRDKYRDCQNSGLSKQASYKQALTFMENYKRAIREVETGSRLSALRKKFIGFLAFSAFFFIALICVYLYISMVAVKSFENTWLIVVGGAFTYLVYLAANALGYAKMFDMKGLSRGALSFLFLSFVPLIYVFPNLLADVLLGKPMWTYSWLAVPVILFLYILTDLIAFGKSTHKKYLGAEIALAGLVLTSAVYLIVAYFYSLWAIAWIVYLVYLSIVALSFYISKGIGVQAGR